jgi:hypothetical protein
MFGGSMNNDLEDQSKRLLQIAEELESAAAHARTASNHFKQSEVPRGCAHSLAVEGHLFVAKDLLEEVAKTHRLKAKPE